MTLSRSEGVDMDRKRGLGIITLAIVMLLACNLTTPTTPEATIDATQMLVFAGQTVVAVETAAMQKTLAAAGGSTTEPGAPPAEATATPTEGPTATLASSATATLTNVPSLTPIPCNLAHFETDVNIPDNWTTTLNDHFTKTWRVRNVGSCTWTSGYTLAFDHGDQMGAPATQPITGATVPPGSTVDISVPLVSPAGAGTFQGWYRIHAPDSSIVVFDNSVNNWFWLKIITVAPTNTPTPTLGFHLPLIPILISYLDNVLTQVAIPAGGQGSALATCPAHSIVVGGGFAGGADNMVIYTSYMSGNGWQVFAKNNGGGSQLLNSYAICLFNTSGATSQVGSVVAIPAPSGAYGTTSVTCPGGSIMTGGGFKSDPVDAWVYNMEPIGTTTITGWETYIRNLGTPSSATLYAICLTGVSATTELVRNQTTVPANGTGGVTAACPSGFLGATGGGFITNDGLRLYNSSMGSDKKSWEVYAKNNTAGSPIIRSVVACIKFT
jgi:hypothetical protein